MNLLQQLRHDLTIKERKTMFKLGDNVMIKMDEGKGKTSGLIAGFSRCGNATNVIVLFKTSTGVAKMTIPLHDPKITITKLSSSKKRFRRAKSYYLMSKDKYPIFRKLSV